MSLTYRKCPVCKQEYAMEYGCCEEDTEAVNRENEDLRFRLESAEARAKELEENGIEAAISLLITPLPAFNNQSAVAFLSNEGSVEYIEATIRRIYGSIPLRDRIAVLENEVSVLRQYGNKDCTAMADAVLQALKGDKS